eukprot:XP_014789724.1 PREDICTED: regulating synaptic membrane exocytosis protein 1-like isoform X3 [Octopus bimaculoides]
MSTNRRPSLPPMPDISHLTEDERRIIEDVLKRQREEEEREQQMIQQMQDEFDSYQQAVKKLSEETKQVTPQDEGAVCQICHKTKFADGVGHSCHYCHLKSCARCGGRITMRGNKPVPVSGKEVKDLSGQNVTVIWSCNLCRKKQEILAKTGAWYHGGMARPVALDVGDTASGSETASTKTDVSPPNEKKAKILAKQQTDNGASSEKENIDKKSVSRSGSLQNRGLKRQYSLSEVQGNKQNDLKDRPTDNTSGTIVSEKEKLREKGQLQDRGRDVERGPSARGSNVEGSKHHDGKVHSREESARRYDKRSDRDKSHEKDERNREKHQGRFRDGSTDRFNDEKRVDHSGRETGDHYHERDQRKPRDSSREPSRDRLKGSKESLSSRSHRTDRADRSERVADRNERVDRTAEPHEDWMADRHREGDRRRGRINLESEHYQDPVLNNQDYHESDTRPTREPRQKDGYEEEQWKNVDSSSGHHGRRNATRHQRDHQRADQNKDHPQEAVRGHRDSLNKRDHIREHPAHSRDHRGELQRELPREQHPRERKDHITDSKDSRSPSRDRERTRGSKGDKYSSYITDQSSIQVVSTGHHDREASEIEHRGETDRYFDRKQHLDPNSAANKSSRTNRRKVESMLRNDSLSSDPSDCVRPPPPKPHKHKKGKKQRQQSISSSDDEIRSTPECSSCEEPDMESESVSEKGDFEALTSDDHWKKDEILAAKIKKFLSHPVTWQRSANGRYYIGHMILKKTVLEGTGSRDSSAILVCLERPRQKRRSKEWEGSFKASLKVVGGRMTEKGQLGAFITKVKKGSIADTVGHLRAGDEVVEWNGRSLREATFEEVYDIIFETKHEPQVELIVHRNAKTGEIPPGLQQIEPSGRDYSSKDGLMTRPSVMVTSPGSPSASGKRVHSPQITGKIQIRMWYDDSRCELSICIVSALDLLPSADGKLRNPYCKLYLLPDKSEKTKRRTKTIPNTNDPTWNQTFVYVAGKESHFKQRLLEITVWDYDRLGASEFLGEVIIDLSRANFKDDPLWYPLRQQDESNIQLPTSSSRTKSSHDPGDIQKVHLSPPVGSRGFSDSDMSEFDYDDSFQTGAALLERMGGSSISSLSSAISAAHLNEDYSEIMDGRCKSRRDRGVGSPTTRRRSGTVIARDELDDHRKHNHPEGGSLVVPEKGTRQRSRSPVEDMNHGSSRTTRSPARHQVPETLSRSLSPHSSRQNRGMSPIRVLPTTSRSAGGTPSSTPSPKKRQLPSIPIEAQIASRDRVTQDLEERARQMKLKMKINAQHRHGTANHGAPSSDSEIAHHHHRSRLRDGDYRHDRYDIHGYHSRGRDLERGHRSRRRKEFSPDVSDDNLPSDASETSDMSEVSKVSTISMRSTQSERPHRKFSEFTSKMESRTTIPKRQIIRSPSSESSSFERNDGSISDSAVSSSVIEGRKRRPSLGHKVAAFVGLSRRSSSAVQLAETNKKKGSVIRSEEVGGGLEMRSRLAKQSSRDSTDGSMGSISSIESSVMWLPPSHYGDFVEGLGPSQLVGRQVLGAPCLGEIQLGLYDRKGHLEVEVIRARGLMAKPGAKVLPAPYVKVYLIQAKHTVEKQKTTIARRTLDPLYQQQLVFNESYQGRVLQVTVWGDYSRTDRKVFMGVAQIVLDELDLSNIVIGWYKLFPTSSLVGHHSGPSSASSPHTRKSSASSLETLSTATSWTQ